MSLDPPEIRADERGDVDEGVAVRPDTLGDAAAAFGPSARQRGQTGERAEEHATVLVVFGTDDRTDPGRPGRRVLGGEPRDRVGVDAADRARPFRGPVGDRLAQLVVAERVLGDPLVVRQPVADDDVHHRQHHRDVGAGEGLDEPVPAVGVDGFSRGGADRVDHHDPRADGSGPSRWSATDDGW